MTLRRVAIAGGKPALREVAPLPLGHDELRIEVAFAGICGSDFHAMHDAGDPDGVGAESFGHEYTGVVREIGPGVNGLDPGDAVVCMPRISCRRCAACRAGNPTLCVDFAMPEHGAWADEIVVPERVAFKLPPGLTPENAVLTEPLACALRGVHRARAPHSHVAVVIGGGPMGLLTAALALRSGARLVLVSEPRAARRELARRLGAIPFDPRAGSLADAVREATAGRGADVVYEAVGRAETVAQGIELLAPRGTVVVLGVAPADAQVPVSPLGLFLGELTVTGAFGPEAMFEQALAWLPALDLDPIVTDVLPLAEIGVAVQIARSGDCGKVLLRPSA